jgi:D-tyrosyl-tRNA(Tyr) deacylase
MKYSKLKRTRSSPRKRVPCATVRLSALMNASKGNRPSFSAAARPESAEPLYERFCSALREYGIEVATGVFGARMLVEIENEGPVTVLLET